MHCRLLRYEQSSNSKATSRSTIYKRVSKIMSLAFMNVCDVDVVQHIHDFVPRRPDVEWED